MHYYAHGEASGRVRITYGDDVSPATQKLMEGSVVCRLHEGEARPLAASILEAHGNGNIGITFACPLCRRGIITIQYDPGYPQRNYMPNGDPGYPGEPSSIEGIDATCGCWPQELQDKVFADQGYEEWLCTLYSRNPVACDEWVRDGHDCAQGHVQYAGAPRRLHTEAHPIYTWLERLVEVFFGLADYFAVEAEAAWERQAAMDDVEAQDAAIDYQIQEQRRLDEEAADREAER